ncbi:hypothetical protein RJ639_007520 [Escallonia herrerae]|uniref:Reverse transcriptase Ty1/copia-type domain-containing protein n=1 Tax=Escallonia herrerae TaxID=1293975 RepID=A0AA89AUH0_9ASTE|nr:hypothetical protein RJ639_007520 [Escallonia herrerae]
MTRKKGLGVIIAKNLGIQGRLVGRFMGSPPTDNRAFQVSNEGNQGQQSTQEASPFTKEQLEHLYTLFQSPHFQEMVSGRMIGSARASGGLDFVEDGTNSGKHGENKDDDSEFFYSQPTVSPENITMADGPNFLINTELSGLNKENLDSKSIGLSHDIDGNKNGGTTGTKELLVYSRRKQIQRNGTDASQYCQDSVPQTIQNSIEATGDTHAERIHLNLPSPESSQSESSMSDLDKPIAHRKGIRKDDIAEMERLKQCLASKFEIKDLGSLKFFLGMEIARSRKGIAVSQRKYVLDLLKETGISGCRPVETLIDPNQKLGGNKGDPVNTSRYQKLVGKLIYLSHTRPDIAFAVSLDLSQAILQAQNGNKKHAEYFGAFKKACEWNTCLSLTTDLKVMQEQQEQLARDMVEILNMSWVRTEYLLYLLYPLRFFSSLSGLMVTITRDVEQCFALAIQTQQGGCCNLVGPSSFYGSGSRGSGERGGQAPLSSLLGVRTGGHYGSEAICAMIARALMPRIDTYNITFETTHMGRNSLGIEVARSSEGTLGRKILETPTDPNMKLTSDKGDSCLKLFPMVKTAMTGACRSLDSSEATSSTLGGTLRPTLAHGGDHLSQLSFQLTSHKLTGKNYLEWAQSVKLAIDGRGKLGHLTGDVRQPTAGDPSLSVWRSENS